MGLWFLSRRFDVLCDINRFEMQAYNYSVAEKKWASRKETLNNNFALHGFYRCELENTKQNKFINDSVYMMAMRICFVSTSIRLMR